MFKFARRQHLEGSINLAKRRVWYAREGEGEGDNNPPPPEPKPKPDPTPEAKFTQADVDKITGNRAKEATAAAHKKLLEAIGADPNDPKALETVKALIDAGKQAEDAKKTADQKNQERIAALEKERDDALAREKAVEERRRTSLVDGKLEALASKAGAQFPSDVTDYARRTLGDDVKALLGDEDKFDDKKAQTLIDAIKKVRPNFFDMRRGAGTGSHGGGDRGALGETDLRAAQQTNMKRALRDL